MKGLFKLSSKNNQGFTFLRKAVPEQGEGFTLIEILIYFGLLSVILIFVVDLFLNVGEFSISSRAEKQLQEDGSFILNRLSYDIQRADSILQPTNFGEDENSLSLQIGSETVSYSLSGTALLLSETVSGRSGSLNSNLTRLNTVFFRKVGSAQTKPTIKINLQLEYVDPTKQGNAVKNFETVVGLR